MQQQRPFVLTESMMQWVHNGKVQLLVAGDPLWNTAALGLLLNDEQLLNAVLLQQPVDLTVNDGPWKIEHTHENQSDVLESSIGPQALELFIRILSTRKAGEHVQMKNVHGVTLYSTSPHNG